MPTYSAAEIIGKTLVANKNIQIWKIPSKPSTGEEGVKWSDIYVKKNDALGVVYSYLGGTGGDPLFWVFNTPGVNVGQIGANFYVPHAVGNFNIESLKEQGVLTTAERAELEAEENKSTGDKIVDAFKKGGKYLLIAGGIYFAIVMYKEFKK